MSLFEDGIFNLAEVARRVAIADPTRVAVIEPAGRANGARRYARYTYAALSHDAESVAVGLRDIGIAEGTRTVFMAPPSYRACVLGLALTRVGATTVWIDPAVGFLNVGERLRRVKPEAFVGVPLAHLGRIAFGWGPRVGQTRILVGPWRFPGYHTLESLRREPPVAPAPPAVSPDDPVAILYTTGSTGPAKPVQYLHHNFADVYRIVHASWRFDQLPGPPVDMAAFPAFGFIALSAGGTVVVPPIDFARQGPADADAAAVIDVINDCGVTSLFGSPALLANMARCAETSGVRTPSLRRVVGGGAPIPASTMAPLLRMIASDGDVMSDYGATEALPATELSARECLADTWSATERGAGICVGRPFDRVEIRILRIVDEPLASMRDAVELPAGQIGEIAVRGPHVSPAYVDDEANTRWHKVPDPDGGFWHRVGDAGYVDDSGRLWYCGRVSQRVTTDAGTVFPLQAEPILNRHPAVRRSALVGVGNAAVLCVEVEPGCARRDRPRIRKELLALASSHPATCAIRAVLFRRRLPVDPRHNSKIDRPSLTTWAARALPADVDVAKPGPDCHIQFLASADDVANGTGLGSVDGARARGLHR